MFYDKLASPPIPGSLQEVACIIIQRYRQEQQLNALWATMAEGAELKRTALEAYKKSLVPYIEKSRERESKSVHERMMRYLEDGPIYIKVDKDEK